MRMTKGCALKALTELEPLTATHRYRVVRSAVHTLPMSRRRPPLVDPQLTVEAAAEKLLLMFLGDAGHTVGLSRTSATTRLSGAS